MSFFENFRRGIADVAKTIAYDPVDRALSQPDPIIPNDNPISPTVVSLLEDEDHAVRYIGHLANGNKDNTITKIAKTVVENNGALPIETVAEKTGLLKESITKTVSLFTGHFANEQEIIIAEPLLPKLPKEGDVFLG